MRRPDQVIVLAAALGIESLVVNQGVKRIFRRRRPTMSGDERYTVRRPSTSSFPSGHASSAAFIASLVIAWDGKRWAPLWLSLATIVGVSRAYVRIHHASDVVGGAVFGLALAGHAAPSCVASPLAEGRESRPHEVEEVVAVERLAHASSDASPSDASKRSIGRRPPSTCG